MSEAKCDHDQHFKGNCMACRAEKAEADRDHFRNALHDIAHNGICPTPEKENKLACAWRACMLHCVKIAREALSLEAKDG